MHRVMDKRVQVLKIFGVKLVRYLSFCSNTNGIMTRIMLTNSQLLFFIYNQNESSSGMELFSQ